MQIESIDRGRQILAAGARDLRPVVLSKLIQPFMDVAEQLMERQTKIPPTVLNRKELLLLGESIRSGVDVLESLGIPMTVGHLDLNPGNIIVSPSRCVFLDWAEAYLGNPFLSFEYLLEHLRRKLGIDSAAEATLIKSYRTRWEQVVPSSAIAQALELAPLLAVFAYAAGSNAWADGQNFQDPGIAGYFRSLTRRMSREAHVLADRRSLCLR
jgi:hypothetical protein